MIRMNKKGFTLVEVLAATLILAIITIAIILLLNFSQKMVQVNSSKDAYAAEVQTAADAIICYMNSGLTTVNEIEHASRVDGEIMYIDGSTGYDTNENKIQFKIEPSGESSSLKKITVAIFYGPANDRDTVEFICYAHEDW